MRKENVISETGPVLDKITQITGMVEAFLKNHIFNEWIVLHGLHHNQ